MGPWDRSLEEEMDPEWSPGGVEWSENELRLLRRGPRGYGDRWRMEEDAGGLFSTYSKQKGLGVSE